MPVLWGRVLLGLVWLVPVGVLIQALTAMPTVLFLRGSIPLHGSLSFLVLGCAVGAAIFAWAVRLRRSSIALAILSCLALVGQTLLGYVSRAPRISDHEPLPVDDGLVVVHVSAGMFLLVFTLAVAFKVSRDVRLQRAAAEWTGAAHELDERAARDDS